MCVAYFDFYLLLIYIMLWLFAANKVVYIYSKFVPKTHRYIRLQNAVTLKTGLVVRQGH